MNMIFVFVFLIGQDAYIVIASRMPQSGGLSHPQPNAPAGDKNTVEYILAIPLASYVKAS